MNTISRIVMFLGKTRALELIAEHAPCTREHILRVATEEHNYLRSIAEEEHRWEQFTEPASDSDSEYPSFEKAPTFEGFSRSKPTVPNHVSVFYVCKAAYLKSTGVNLEPFYGDSIVFEDEDDVVVTQQVGHQPSRATDRCWKRHRKTQYK